MHLPLPLVRDEARYLRRGGSRVGSCTAPHARTRTSTRIRGHRVAWEGDERRLT